MIDRYILHAEASALISRFGLREGISTITSFNATPTDLLPVITNIHPDKTEMTFWGQSPEWSNNKKLSVKLYNASLSGAQNTRSLSQAIEKRRCLIPATGFVVWNKLGKKTSVPYLYHLPDFKLFSMAGVWEDSLNIDDQGYRTFKLLTRNSEELNVVLPVIVKSETEKGWLSGSIDANIDTMIPLQEFITYSISPVIHSSRTDNIEMIKHVPPVDQRGNYTLFG